MRINKKRIFKIVMPTIATAISLVFVPWMLLRIMLTPLPDTVQEQVEDATKYGLDGIIVC